MSPCDGSICWAMTVEPQLEQTETGGTRITLRRGMRETLQKIKVEAER
jgi:hypothetical protein